MPHPDRRLQTGKSFPSSEKEPPAAASNGPLVLRSGTSCIVGGGKATIMSEQPQIAHPEDQPAALERESYPLDALFVGGGPAGLAGAIRLSQRIQAHNESGQGAPIEAEIAVIEKAEEFGLHGLSGAVLDPSALAELYPDYRDRGCPLSGEIREEGVFLLTERRAHRIPGFALPRNMHNRGLPAVSLQRLTRWLAEQAEQEGVFLFPGTAGVKLLTEKDRVTGVRTGDKGLQKGGGQAGNFEPGLDLNARVSVFCEGPRGTLSEDLIAQFGLRADCNPQSYSLGVKEIVRVERTTGRGVAYHTMGYPLPSYAFGGGWIYELDEQTYSVGFVAGLDWRNPTLDVQEELQRYKAHPLVAELLHGGEVVHYGAKTIPEGGYFALPRLYAPGALLAGDSAGMVNVPTLKGIHYAMRSGMLAADTVFEALKDGDASEEKLRPYQAAVEHSEIGKDLWASRNFRSSFHQGLYKGVLCWGWRMMTGGGSRRRTAAEPDWKAMGSVKDFPPRAPRPASDGKLLLDKLTDVHLSGTSHRDDAPSHIRILDPGACVDQCIPRHGTAPCEHFCPARVFELQGEGAERRIDVAFQNCVHCKTCVIVDPCDTGPDDGLQNIQWRAPAEGGPKYVNL
jgi:electron-transferring-flavoprotein dehydrogenase